MPPDGSDPDGEDPPDSDPRIGREDDDRAPEDPVVQDEEVPDRGPSVGRRETLFGVGGALTVGTGLLVGGVGVAIDDDRDEERTREGLVAVARERADRTATLLDGVREATRALADEAIPGASDPGAVLSDRVERTGGVRSAHLLDGGTVVASSRESAVGGAAPELPGFPEGETENDDVVAYAVDSGHPVVGTLADVDAAAGDHVYVTASLATMTFSPPVAGAVTFLVAQEFSPMHARVVYDSGGASLGRRYPSDLAFEVTPPGRLIPEDDDGSGASLPADETNVVRARPEGAVTASVPEQFEEGEYYVVYAAVREDLAAILHAPVSTAVDRYEDDGEFFALR